MEAILIAEGFVDDNSSDLERDRAIILRVVGGEKEAFRELVVSYKHQVFSSIMRQTGNHELADDLTQETFIRAFRSLNTFRFEARFSTWLTRVALNTTASHFASKAHRKEKKTIVFEHDAHAQSSASVEEAHLRKEQLRDYQAALNQLRPKLREVLVLCGLEGKSYSEVADLLGVPVGTVRSRLNTARLEMKSLVRG